MSKIMVVDDEPEISILVRAMLEKEGYTVVEADSGKECLKKLKKEKPDLILLDVMMPEEDGWKILKEIKKPGKTKDIPVVAMFTVKTNHESIVKSFERGADAHINKPFKIEKLLDQVKRLLEKGGST